MHAEKCPVCDGKGTIPSCSMCSTLEITCHGCNGIGWVQVSDIEDLPFVTPYYGIFKPPQTTARD